MKLTRLVLGVALFLSVLSATAQRPERPPQVVRVGTVQVAEVAPTIAVPGTIYSRDEVQITAGIGGLLSEVLEPGTVVVAGQTVAAIDPTTLRLQRAEQEALLARAQIQVRQLESERRRQAQLSTTSAVSEFQLEQTVANRDLAQADARIIEVRIRQIDDQIRRATTTAPFNGIIVQRMHRAGEEVARGTSLARLTSTDNLEVRAFVPLKYFSRVHVDDLLTIFNDASRLTGAIRALIPTGDVRSQTFEARIDLPDDIAGSLAVGELVSVGIPIRAGEQSLAVPRDAVVLRSDGNYVMRISDENKAEKIIVELGDSAGELIAVEGELREGDRVAIRGGETLADGAPVEINES
ncbi:MAG: efflux RND transporter periplasmic adaptor subunit [Gammaproteobacteria bacterium]|nr:efflux RND transporter periplasmic adaptor subunit [Gammaproteobacteria bacterium]